MPTVYLSIGSNLGSRKENCKRAVALLKKKGIAVSKLSSMIETEPWGIEQQQKFINLAVEIITELRPGELLRCLKEIEAELGRAETIRWGPRIIDLDILFYNDTVINLPGLVIPHTGVNEREFVLKPLSEIAPDKIHPVLNKSVRELLQEIEKKS
jgi:dihydroneopterin aldolase/2-amino-4-hydroxy-6-hydroxymethyldihydropteridine diphosphokinase